MTRLSRGVHHATGISLQSNRTSAHVLTPRPSLKQFQCLLYPARRATGFHLIAPIPRPLAAAIAPVQVEGQLHWEKGKLSLANDFSLHNERRDTFCGLTHRSDLLETKHECNEDHLTNAESDSAWIAC
jgi:hypothetical protein